jgi:hypothetical protein
MESKKVLWFDNIQISLFSGEHATVMIDTFVHTLIDELDNHHESLYLACTTDEHGGFSWVGYPVYERSEVLDIVG